MFRSRYCFVLFASFIQVAVCISDEHKAQIQASFESAGKKCLAEHPITVDEIADLKQRRVPEGRDAACFSACVLTQIGILDDKGEIAQATALESAKQVFDTEEEVQAVQEFFETCAKGAEAGGDDGCSRAKLLFQCFVDNAVKFNF